MKLGITCEGGAFRTIFSSGVLDAILENEIYADYFIGVSAGIGYGISYCSRQKGRNLEILRRFAADKRYLSWRNFFNRKNKSVYGLKFAFEEVPKKHIPFDHETYSKVASSTFAVVTNIETGKPEYLSFPAFDESFDVIKASCAMPELFPIIELDGKKYMDGGVSDPIPFKKAMQEGCDKNIVILTREDSYEKKQKDKMMEFAARRYKKYPEFQKVLRERNDNYNKCREELFGLEKNGEVFVFRPDDTKGFSRLEKDPVKIENMYKQGYEIGLKRMEELKEYLKK